MSRPVFTGSPCAAWLDVATAQLDLARHTQRASLRDSISACRIPHIKSSCSARHKGRKCKTPQALTQHSLLVTSFVRYPIFMLRAMLCLLLPPPRDEEQRNQVLRHCFHGRRSGVDTDFSHLRQERSVGFAVVLFDWISGDLSDGARDGFLRAEAVVALGRDTIRGAVRLAVDKWGRGESSAAGNYCVCGDVIARSSCGEGWGLFWQKQFWRKRQLNCAEQFDSTREFSVGWRAWLLLFRIPLCRAEQLDSTRSFRRALVHLWHVKRSSVCGNRCGDIGLMSPIQVLTTRNPPQAYARREPSQSRSEARCVCLARSSCAVALSSQAAQGDPVNTGCDTGAAFFGWPFLAAQER